MCWCIIIAQEATTYTTNLSGNFNHWVNYPFNEVWVLFVCVTFGFGSQSCCTVLLQFPRLSMFWQCIFFYYFIFLKSSMLFCPKNCHCPAVHCHAYIKMRCTQSSCFVFTSAQDKNPRNTESCLTFLLYLFSLFMAQPL